MGSVKLPADGCEAFSVASLSDVLTSSVGFSADDAADAGKVLTGASPIRERHRLKSGKGAAVSALSKMETATV